jgi:hypothetical protein
MLYLKNNDNKLYHQPSHSLNMKEFLLIDELPKHLINEEFPLYNPPIFNKNIIKHDLNVINTFIYFLSHKNESDVFVNIKNISSFFVNINKEYQKLSILNCYENKLPFLRIQHDISTIQDGKEYMVDIFVKKFDLTKIIKECLESLDIIDDINNTLIKELLLTIPDNTHIGFTLVVPDIDIQTNISIPHVMKVILYWCTIPKDLELTSENDIYSKMKEINKQFKSMIKIKYSKNNYCISISSCKLEYE